MNGVHLFFCHALIKMTWTEQQKWFFSMQVLQSATHFDWCTISIRMKNRNQNIPKQPRVSIHVTQSQKESQNVSNDFFYIDPKRIWKNSIKLRRKLFISIKCQDKINHTIGVCLFDICLHCGQYRKEEIEITVWSRSNETQHKNKSETPTNEKENG